MGSLTLNKIDRLFWMGRYAERVNTTLGFMMDYFDQLIDGRPMPHEEFCRRMALPDIYASDEEFLRDYALDAKNEDSLWVAADRMLGNGMTLRETISSATLSYLQLAVNALTAARTSSSPMLEFQTAIDSIMAFRGSFDDNIDDMSVRNLVKAGFTVERLSLFLRLGYPDGACIKEICKLVARVPDTLAGTRSGAYAALLVTAQLGDQGSLPIDRSPLISAAEELFDI